MKKKPKFKRQQSYLKKLKDKWKKPRGKDSKMRKGIRGKIKRVKIGYGSPKSEPDYTRVFNAKDLESLKPNEKIIIASSVGKKKKNEIMKVAEEKKIEILNIRKYKSIT